MENCEDCETCTMREKCGEEQHLACPACGATGTIQNIFDEKGAFLECACSKELHTVLVDGYNMPVCKNCGVMMEPEEDKD
jgi:hypothetical protein